LNFTFLPTLVSELFCSLWEYNEKVKDIKPEEADEIDKGDQTWTTYFKKDTSENEMFKYDCTDIFLSKGSTSLTMNFSQTFQTPREHKVLCAEVDFRIEYMSTDLNRDNNNNILEVFFGKKKHNQVPIDTVPSEFYTEEGSDFSQKTKRIFGVTDYFDDAGKFHELYSR
jgi:hypothetical protein